MQENTGGIQIDTRTIKRALIRWDGGKFDQLYIKCGCGEHLLVDKPFTGDYVPCTCGFVYDSRGWVVNSGLSELRTALAVAEAARDAAIAERDAERARVRTLEAELFGRLTE